MLTTTEHFSLTSHNTLGIDSVARVCCTVDSDADLPSFFEFLKEQNISRYFVLGGGSNLVLPKYYDGAVLRIADTTFHLEQQSDQAVVVLGAGLEWHQVVMRIAQAGYRGIENLALIPGTVGATPVQNIGAYGVEISDTLRRVWVWDTHSQSAYFIEGKDCQFGYRDSVFKRQAGRYIILRVELTLSLSSPYQLRYDGLERLSEIEGLTPLDVARQVIAIRQSKLPDPTVTRNAGSFFKNPIVPAQQARDLAIKYPLLKCYPVDAQQVKLAAGWLIDQCGWKGYQSAFVGTYKHQALVLVNRGGSQRDVLEFAKRIQNSVFKRFQVNLEIEPVVIC